MIKGNFQSRVRYNVAIQSTEFQKSVRKHGKKGEIACYYHLPWYLFNKYISFCHASVL